MPGRSLRWVQPAETEGRPKGGSQLSARRGTAALRASGRPAAWRPWLGCASSDRGARPSLAAGGGPATAAAHRLPCRRPAAPGTRHGPAARRPDPHEAGFPPSRWPVAHGRVLPLQRWRTPTLSSGPSGSAGARGCPNPAAVGRRQRPTAQQGLGHGSREAGRRGARGPGEAGSGSRGGGKALAAPGCGGATPGAA